MSTNNIGFRDTSKLSEWIVNLAILRIILAIIVNLTPMTEGEEILTTGDWIVTMGAMILIISNIIGGIFLFRWIYLSNINSTLMGAKNMQFSPGWSVGWFFIPLMNLFMPFRAMKEIWKTSKDSKNWESLETPSIIIWWWVLFIVSGVSANLSWEANLGNTEFSEGGILLVTFLDAGIAIAYWLVLINMVKEISKMQNQVLQKLQGMKLYR